MDGPRVAKVLWWKIIKTVILLNTHKNLGKHKLRIYHLFLQFHIIKLIFHHFRISPIIVKVDWKLGASKSQTLSARSGKNMILKGVCSRFADYYGIPAINTWPVGRHLALLDKMIKDRIRNEEWLLCNKIEKIANLA